ncbi:uncharacterized protein LOC143018358 [Oratosquilla oratoria]|uniref:uncharacterized protein LOC143018358 n=2 Tax=Oratosquilla oratoria TaxID=337810 RepID=UPI003F7712E2
MSHFMTSNIQFTMEIESHGHLPFLDTEIIRRDSKALFRVYRKPTNKDDLLHFYSAHNERTKVGVVIGFFLRALRICSREFLEDEILRIKSTFRALCYPEGLLSNSLRKARDIRQRKNPINRKDKQFLIVPGSDFSRLLGDAVRPLGLEVVNDTGKRIKQLVTPTSSITNNLSIIYKIPCGGCEKSYYGESYRGLETRIKEHKADLRHHRLSNAMVNHVEQEGHLPDWQQAEIIRKGLRKGQRKVIEALYISTNSNINQKVGNIKWTKYTAEYAKMRNCPNTAPT